MTGASPQRLKWFAADVDLRAGSRRASELALMSVSAYWGVRRRDEITSDPPRAESLDNYKICRSGDIVINKMSAYQGAFGVSPSDGLVSPDYAVLRPSASVDPRWLVYSMKTPHFMSEISNRLRGIGDVAAANVRTPRISMTDLLDISWPIPAFEEQRRIADFLDRETAQIDALIAKQEQFIGLLGERRDTVVHDAIPRADEDPTSDKLGRRARITNGSTPRREVARYWDGGDFPWLNSAVVNRSEVTWSDQFVTSDALAECHLPVTRPGDLLVALTGQGKTRGTASIVRMVATINQHLACISPDRSRWLPEYLLWSLRSSYGDLRRVSDESGATKGALTVDALSRHRLVMPSIEKQALVVADLEERTARIEALISKTQEHIALAKERRAALITEAVTGRFDVSSGRAA